MNLLKVFVLRFTNVVFSFVLLFTSTQLFAGTITQSGFSYITSTPEIHYQVTVNKKTILSATMIVVDIGGVAQAGHEVATAELISQENVPSTFTFSKPSNGWPEGYYEIVVKDNERTVESVMFNVIPESGSAAASHDSITPSTPSNPENLFVSDNNGILAQGAGGSLTADAANAYIDALEFIHGQMGEPRSFLPQERQTIMSNLASAYPSFPVGTQQDLAAARSILFEYQNSWNYIGVEEQKEFAYQVLAIAYGEQAAAQALGYNSGSGSGSSGGGSSYYSDGASYVSDGNCAIFSSEYGSVSSCD
ncbi:hypothetical protein [Litoribacillus peritrichatus]|uniref:Uncharacterized protein n=1 Tax=Litoribacillus peritrichatus TaxID=718191 RepID=A0ABP7ME56_9GAMM